MILGTKKKKKKKKTCNNIIQLSGAPNEISWQISAPQPPYSWLAFESEQIQNPSWQTENITILWI